VPGVKPPDGPDPWSVLSQQAKLARVKETGEIPGKSKTTILYGITKFEDFPIEELGERWSRPPGWAREHPKKSRKAWIENHHELWQYLKPVEEGKSGSFDEVGILAEGLKKLPNMATIRLAFAFQKKRL
jgi:hypothetical protein